MVRIVCLHARLLLLVAYHEWRECISLSCDMTVGLLLYILRVGRVPDTA